MDLAFSGTQPVLVVAALAAVGAWLAAAGVLFVSRRPPEPALGPKTLELGPEPPAVANFLVHGFRVTDEAVPATLIDLAARNVVEIEERGPGAFYVRLRPRHELSLTAYEERVLEHLESLASDGVVPAGALTTGPQEQSKKWRQRFVGEVVADAQRRGLARDAVGGPVFAALTGAAVIPAVLVAALASLPTGVVAFAAAVVLLGWIRKRHPQRETAAGMEAASRWLGVRAAIQEDEEFSRQSPLTVELWDRLLAYGAALGVASGSSRPLPMGIESDTHAWSAYGGHWRRVYVSYPRLWPPAWGKDPVVACLAGAAVVVGTVAFLYWAGPYVFDTDVIGVLLVLVACVAFVLGVAVIVMAASDFLTSVEVTGPILRLRTYGSDDARGRKRYYAAVDDGSSEEIRAFRVSERQYAEIGRQGDVVTFRVTPHLGCVRWLIRADPAPSSSAASSTGGS